jgi:hypothetical protein
VKPLDPEKVIPKRELVVDQSEEEYALTADPSRYGSKFVEVLQDRYAAVFSVQFRNLQPTEMRLEGLERDLTQQSGVGMQDIDFRSLVAKAPRDRLPSAEILAGLPGTPFFGIQVSRRDEKALEPPDSEPFLGGRSRAMVRTLTLQLVLTAPTAERAKELARTALVLYDNGYSFPAYCGYVALIEFYSAEAADERTLIKTMQEQLAGDEKELSLLKPYEEVTSEALASLVSQKQLNTVERAGVLARIAACQKISDEIRKRNVPAQAAEKAETIKIAAEIELAGLEAKQAAIDLLVQKSRRRLQMAGIIYPLRSRIGMAEGRADRNESRAALFKTAVDEKMPFAKVEGKILIRRIKWEQPKPPAKQ